MTRNVFRLQVVLLIVHALLRDVVEGVTQTNVRLNIPLGRLETYVA